MKARDERFICDVLEIVNTGRKAMGKRKIQKLPKGRLQQMFHCPLANAFGKGVGVDEATIYFQDVATAHKVAKVWGMEISEYDRTVPAPTPLRRFVRRFDHEKFPELVVPELIR